MGELRASITTDTNGWFKAVSPAFLELIGRPVESLAGVNLIDLLHPLDAASARQLLTQVGPSGSTPSPVRMLAADDTWRPLTISMRDGGDARITVDLVSPAESLVVESPFQAPAVASPIWSVARAASLPGHDAAADDPSFAGPNVPGHRAAVRETAPAGVPMIEIDADGRTTFATGPWKSLSAADNDGAAAFEELLGNTNKADEVLDLVAAVMQNGQARQIETQTVQGSRWLQVLPIPSPHHQGVLHALVAVANDRLDGDLVSGAAPTLSPAPATLQNWAAAGSPVAAAAPPAATETPAAPLAPAGGEPPPTLPLPKAPPDEAESGSAGPTGTTMSPDSSILPTSETELAPEARSGRGFFGWLALGIAALLVIVLISKLWPSGENTADTGPVEVEIIAADAVETDAGQTWRSVGVGALGEAHGIAATADGAYLAGISGTIVKLDSTGAALGAITVGGGETSFVSDIDVDDSGTAWVLDAGQGRLFRVNPDESVNEVVTDPNPLRNARGVGVSTDGTAWIASTASAQLTLIASDGATVEIISLPGRQPSDVVDVGDNTMWIVDSEQLEVVHLSLVGEVLHTIPLDSFTSLNSPHLTIVDGALWVTEPEMSAVFEVDLATGQATGERVVLIRPGDVRVDKPIGISSDADGRLWIADSNGGATIIIDN